MAEAGLDGLLCFRQESMFWLTGYDTFGYVYFQCLYLGADGTMTLLTRAPDLRQAQQTSVIGDIRIWIDRPDAGPAEQLRNIRLEHGGLRLFAWAPPMRPTGWTGRCSSTATLWKLRLAWSSSSTSSSSIRMPVLP